MKRFRNYITELEGPRSEVDKMVVAMHPVKTTDYPVPGAGENDVKTKKDKSRKADLDADASEAAYNKANGVKDPNGEVKIQSGRAYSKEQVMTYFRSESVEPIEELSKERLSSYSDKAKKDYNSNFKKWGKKATARVNKRVTGLVRANKKMNESVQIDEVDSDLMKKFLAKGGKVTKGETKPMDAKLSATNKSSKGGKAHVDASAVGDTHAVKVANEKRAKGTLGDYSKFHASMAARRKKLKEEEIIEAIDQLDEISKGRLSSYLDKNHAATEKDSSHGKDWKKKIKREKGADLAYAKSKHGIYGAKVKATNEEVIRDGSSTVKTHGSAVQKQNFKDNTAEERQKRAKKLKESILGSFQLEKKESELNITEVSKKRLGDYMDGARKSLKDKAVEKKKLQDDGEAALSKAQNARNSHDASNNRREHMRLGRKFGKVEDKITSRKANVALAAKKFNKKKTGE